MSNYRKYGYFAKDSFVITRPDTPRPWINYIGNSEYAVRFSQTGGGDSFHKFPRVNNVTYSHYDDATEIYDDRPGRWVYLQDAQNGNLWSLNWQPVMSPYQTYKCVHAPGYSKITSRNNDIESSLRVFVPLEGSLEIWTVEIVNHREQSSEIIFYPFVEWFLTDDFCKSGYFAGNHGKYIPTSNLLHYWYCKQKLPGQHYTAFLRPDFKPDGYEFSRRNFLGVYGNYHTPATIVARKCSCKPCDYEPMVGVLQKKIFLKPGASFSFTLALGTAQNINEAILASNKYMSSDAVEESFAAVKSYWTKRLSTCQVETPDSDFDHMVNTWLKYQVHTTSFWVRPGGDKGFRDICQDAENILSFDVPRSKNLLIEAMRHQFKCGRAVRQWPQHPSGRLDTRDYRDSPVWLVYSVCEYVKESADIAFLDETVPYLDNGSDTVYEHVKKAIDCLWNDRGEHGLSHIGCGDWNDGLDEVGLKGKGESVWLSMALVRGLNEASALASEKGDNVTCADYLAKAKLLTGIINKVAWNGTWYSRAINDDGLVIGSNKERRIFLLPQAWAMLAGISNEEQNNSMIDSIYSMMMTDFGPIKIAPTYTNYQPGIGKIAYRPGFSEAGAVYIHAAAFLIAGLCQLNKGDLAYDVLRRILPNNPKNPPDNSFCEPNIVANFYMGPQTVCPGRTLYSWLTASGGWLYKNGIARICGITPTYKGLDIKPCLPSDWDKVKVKRQFRKAWFEIEINRTGTQTVMLNGKPAKLPIENIAENTTYKILLTL